MPAEWFDLMQTPMIVTFGIYLITLITVGLYYYKRSANIEDYLLGGRSLGRWVTALSAQASDMSGWLLMGLPGAVYLDGTPASWIAIGLLLGTLINWKYISVRLRVYTQKTDSLTLPIFFENRFRDPTGLLRTLSAVVTLIFFTLYVSSGLVASGKLFESMFGIGYGPAVIVGGLIIITYTFLGGFLAVCYTDFIQGTLMLIAIVAVPAVAYSAADGYQGISLAMAARNIPSALLPVTGLTLTGIISTMAWGLGYFGQPHILVRFMGIKSAGELPKAMRIALLWVIISLGGALASGLTAIPLFSNLPPGDHEKVFIYMINLFFNPWFGGILLAAIMSAIMSTIDSQLLVLSSTLTEDFYQKAVNRKASQKELVFIGRMSVIIVSVAALALAMNPRNTILGLVAYAWGGFGAAFGPLVISALFSRKASWQSALGGMVTGTVVLILWKHLGFGDHMYEIVPGFLANTLCIYILNQCYGQENREILEEFDSMVCESRGVLKSSCEN